jgi:hypothetical protein
VSTDAGTITRFDLVLNVHHVIASGLNGPRHMTFADAGESVILVPQPNPSGRVMKIDLTTTPATHTDIAGPTAFAPYSVAVLSSNQLLITCASQVEEVDLTASVYSAAGPVLLGIGFVPADAAHLPNGYADTTIDPTYFFQVKDCPFGGTLPLMINWEHARSIGANFYQVFIEGPVGPPQQIKQPFGDYLWSVPLNEFELATTSASSPDGYYELRSPGQIWLNFWLGLLLDTTGRPNGLNTIRIKLFAAESAATEIGSDTDPGRFASVMIDNTTPIVNLQQILHEPGNVPVNAVRSSTPARRRSGSGSPRRHRCRTCSAGASPRTGATTSRRRCRPTATAPTSRQAGSGPASSAASSRRPARRRGTRPSPATRPRPTAPTRSGSTPGTASSTAGATSTASPPTKSRSH